MVYFYVLIIITIIISDDYGCSILGLMNILQGIRGIISDVTPHRHRHRLQLMLRNKIGAHYYLYAILLNLFYSIHHMKHRNSEHQNIEKFSCIGLLRKKLRHANTMFRLFFFSSKEEPLIKQKKKNVSNRCFLRIFMKFSN